MAPIVLGLAFWTAFTLEGDIVEGFAIRSGPRDVLVWVLAALTAVSVLHNLALYTDRDAWARRLGWVLSGLSLAALGLTAATLSGSPEGLTALSLGFGSLALGLTAVGLALGPLVSGHTQVAGAAVGRDHHGVSDRGDCPGCVVRSGIGRVG